jgi:hypothetical protein
MWSGKNTYHTPLQIPAQPDPTPGAPPLSQIWDPSFLPTYYSARPIFSKYFKKLPSEYDPIAAISAKCPGNHQACF